MASHLEDWKAQQEAKHAVARREGSLTFLAGGGATARRSDREEQQVSVELTLEARKRKELFETTIKALREANFPDEIAYFQDILLKLSLTSAEHEELQKVFWGKIG